MPNPVVFSLPLAVAAPQGKDDVKNLKPETTPGGTPPGGQPGPAPAGTTQSGQPGAGPGGACAPFGDSTFLMIGVFMLVMWLMVMRPESKRRKQEAQMRSSMQAGDKVITASGIHGVIASVGETTVRVRVDTVTMEMEKNAIARVLRDEPAKQAPKKG